MSYTYKGAEGWVKQPNRMVKTFRSGLCMIQQDYIQRKDKVDLFSFREGDRLSDEDAEPCIDGAFIFPAPEYKDMGNGFISCTVTAYGRVNTSGATDTNRRIGDYDSTFRRVFSTGETDSTTITSQKLFEVVAYRFAIRKTEFVTAPDTPELYIYNLDGTKLPVGTTTITDSENTPTSTTTETYFLGRQIENYDGTNYGEFSEVIISVSANGAFTQSIFYGPA
jgi:hypothetical protein